MENKENEVTSTKEEQNSFFAGRAFTAVVWVLALTAVVITGLVISLVVGDNEQAPGRELKEMVEQDNISNEDRRQREEQDKKKEKKKTFNSPAVSPLDPQVLPQQGGTQQSRLQESLQERIREVAPQQDALNG